MLFIIPLIIVVGVVGWVLRPGKKPTISRRLTILVTSVLALAIGIAAIIIQLLHNTTVEVSGTSNNLFLIGLGLIGAYILTSVDLLLHVKWILLRA